MAIKLLDTVVVTKDIPEHKLQCGDIGAVVEVYPPDGYEVESPLNLWMELTVLLGTRLAKRRARRSPSIPAAHAGR